MIDVRVRRLQSFARRNGGDLLVLGPAAFDRTCDASFTAHPFSGWIGSHYRRRLIAWCPVYPFSPRLLGALVHESWHVFGSPTGPARCDEAHVWALAWELALTRRIGCSLSVFQRHWGRLDYEGEDLRPWPTPPPGQLRTASRRVFMRWALGMLRVAATADAFDSFDNAGRVYRLIDADGWPAPTRDLARRLRGDPAAVRARRLPLERHVA